MPWPRKRPAEAAINVNSKKPRATSASAGVALSSVPKGKGKSRTDRVPKAPQELHNLPYRGRCCYSFNLGGCTRPNCPHPHICAKCGGNHSLQTCSSASS
eukprot:5981615-Amphidinium_carterae.1